ncbi:MAG TPA: protein kinase [Candidatus Krumholzibacteria bacterium]|nr:protein kinase [Candidatus Krumholzibacteria bacterium]
MEPNTRLGNYEIVEKIGAGGMGEVYRARDTRLGRDVALKLLPSMFADDAERLGRFEREARLLAALNHPHIAAIYGLEHADGKRFLVLELVPGEDLSDRIAQGPLPLDEALPIARDIAEALEYAHEQGIVHRDLKPANIKITPEGRVKVLDFGLAKALESEDGRDPRLSQSPTVLASSPTIAGVILGTAAYMSPEQARGKSVDKRSDVFAFGSVLYEMLTGKQAFLGDTVSDTLASVLKTQPDAGTLPENTPRVIRELLRRCLEKDVKLRLRDIGEARIAIDQARHGAPDAEETHAAAAPNTGPARFRANLVWGVLTLVIATAAFFASRMVPPQHADGPLRKLAVELEETDPSQSSFRVALSPDGKRVAFILNDKLWVRELSRLEATEIPGTAKAEIPFWSPDGQQIGYRIGSTFYRVSAGGGNSTVISNTKEMFTGGSGAAWTEDDRIVFTVGSKGLLEVPALGGDPVEILPRNEGETDLHEPDVLPGGRGYLFVPHADSGGPNSIAVFANGKRKTLLTLKDHRIWTPRYSSTGHILFRRTPINSGVWAVPFSLSTLEVTGEPFLVGLDGAEPCPGPDGLLVYRIGGANATSQLAWINADGSLDKTISEPFIGIGQPAISPDGTRVAAMVNEDGNSGDIWVYDLGRGTRQRLTFDSGWEIYPCWSPDGKWIYYSSGADGAIHVRAADGTGSDALLGRRGYGVSLSRDDKWMAYEVDDVATTSTDIFVVAMPGDSTMDPKALLNSKADEGGPRISPSGDYLAYVSNESGRDEVYLTRFPTGEGKWQVSVDGGERPRWDDGAARIYFTSETSLMAVDITEQPDLRLGNPRTLFEFGPAGVVTGRMRSYGADRGGKRFVMSYTPAGNSQKSMFRFVVVENWPAEFAKDGK